MSAAIGNIRRFANDCPSMAKTLNWVSVGNMIMSLLVVSLVVTTTLVYILYNPTDMGKKQTMLKWLTISSAVVTTISTIASVFQMVFAYKVNNCLTN